MKTALITLFSLVPVVAFAAGGPTALGPNNGTFGDWTAATYGSGDTQACYAFTTAKKPDPSAGKRSNVMLTVTERKGAHDEVTISFGMKYPKDAKVVLAVGKKNIDFYTQDDNAFTTHGTEAVTAFKGAADAEAKTDLGHGKTVTDDFSLNGFSDAYGAITKACS
ncbi:MAG: hypothetical protein B7X08_07105 [Acidocella sp. 20-63-7]|nr:MAG: hypothetical protein B7X08_07105 [Acidocella sp. 20-63-7]